MCSSTCRGKNIRGRILVRFVGIPIYYKSFFSISLPCFLYPVRNLHRQGVEKGWERLVYQCISDILCLILTPDPNMKKAVSHS